ncbi:hypothetical protein P5V15_010621 [Pogonomyrmex californicus]
MLFTFERYVIRAGTRYLRRCFSNDVEVSANDLQEFTPQSNKNFTLVRREDQKSLKIAFLGAPNVGKSTIVNQLIKRSICPVSSKVHTTQTKANGIYCEANTQLIFMDTPGMVSPTEFKRYKLASSFRTDSKTSLKAADIIGIVQDAENIYTRHKIHPIILELLTKNIRNTIPIILVINKVDRVKKKEILLDLVNTLTKSKLSPEFYDIFMISALTGDGVDDLRTYLLDSAKPRAWEYEEHIYSDKTCEDIIQQTVRAKLMDSLPNEIPYQLQVKLEHFDPGPDDNIKALLSITCPTPRVARLLMRGKTKTKKISQIARMAEEELRHAFRTSVILRLHIQSKT